MSTISRGKKVVVKRNKSKNQRGNNQKTKKLRNKISKNKKRTVRPFHDTIAMGHRDVDIKKIPGGIRVSGMSFLGALEMNPSKTLDPSYEQVVYLNPSSKYAFPKLGLWAKSYSKFSLVHSHLSYENTVGEINSGTVYMYPIYDTEKSRYGTPLEAYNVGSCKTTSVASNIHFPPYKPQLANLKIYDIPDKFNSLKDKSLLQSELPCKFYIGTTGCTGPGGPAIGEAGRLYHHYTVDLLQEDSDLITESYDPTYELTDDMSLIPSGGGKGAYVIGSGNLSLPFPQDIFGTALEYYGPSAPTPLNGNSPTWGCFRIKSSGMFLLQMTIATQNSVSDISGLPSVATGKLELNALGNFGNQAKIIGYSGDTGTTTAWNGLSSAYIVNYLVKIVEPNACFTWLHNDWYVLNSFHNRSSIFWLVTGMTGTVLT
jgi:hypothetical protein